jgi:hypothetical protein
MAENSKCRSSMVPALVFAIVSRNVSGVFISHTRTHAHYSRSNPANPNAIYRRARARGKESALANRICQIPSIWDNVPAALSSRSTCRNHFSGEAHTVNHGRSARCGSVLQELSVWRHRGVTETRVRPRGSFIRQRRGGGCQGREHAAPTRIGGTKLVRMQRQHALR